MGYKLSYISITRIFLLLLSNIISFQLCKSHGVMFFPNQRGALKESKFIPKGIAGKFKQDYHMHFPAGDKSPARGAGKRSQIKAAGKNNWVMYDPLSKEYNWRYGVCGDLKWKNDHLKGGKYYNNGHIVANFSEGQVINIGIAVVGHHNGFHQFYICDVQKCEGQDISESCFTDNHCYQLQRSKNSECDSSKSMRCGPIDRKYPSRWYIPCSKYPLDDYKADFYGGDAKTIQYSLPNGLVCEHCVLQWHWTTGNYCNPPGVLEYFTGPDKPSWGKCVGSGGAIGGYSAVQKECGERFPEEYVQCADVRVKSRESKTEIISPENEISSSIETLLPSTTHFPIKSSFINAPRTLTAQEEEISSVSPNPSQTVKINFCVSSNGNIVAVPK